MEERDERDHIHNYLGFEVPTSHVALLDPAAARILLFMNFNCLSKHLKSNGISLNAITRFSYPSIRYITVSVKRF